MVLQEDDENIMGEEDFQRTCARNGKDEKRFVSHDQEKAAEVVGHVMRKGGLAKLVLEGKVAGKRQRGRRRLNFMGGGWHRLLGVVLWRRCVGRLIRLVSGKW